MGVILSSQQLHEVEKVAHTVMMIKNGKCINHQTDSAPDLQKSTVIEVETTADKETLQQALNEQQVTIQFNGGFYTISADNCSSQKLIEQLIKQKVTVSYFRDITHSTKRFF